MTITVEISLCHFVESMNVLSLLMWSKFKRFQKPILRYSLKRF